MLKTLTARVHCVSLGESEDLWWEGFVQEVGPSSRFTPLSC